jgi:putative aldouronate transport system permease protein
MQVSAGVDLRAHNRKMMRKQWELQVAVAIGILFLIVFSWAPLFGVVIAFKDYTIKTGVAGIFTSAWNSFRYFKEFFGNYRFPELLRNTIMLSVLKLAATFPAAVLLAIMVSEVRKVFAKRLFQTISYLPHFISWALVYTIAYNMFSTKIGVVNTAALQLGLITEPIAYMTSEKLFYGFAIFLSVWKTTGWSAIIFLAAISGVDTALFEAAAVDGAGRLRRIWHITLPSILPAIVTVLIINIGALLGGGMGGSNFELSYLFGNSSNSAMSDIIQTYSFTMGLSKGRFAFAAAVDLCQCVLSVLLVLSSNWLARRVSGNSLF